MSRQMKRAGGLTLVEIMVAILILSIAVLGASGYRYYSSLDSRKAELHTTSARIGTLLCESWHGTNGDEDYDPVAHLSSELAITPFTSVSSSMTPGFTALGEYQVVVDGDSYYAALAWADVAAGLRALNVVVVWTQRDGRRSDVGDPTKAFRLTTYTSI